MYPDDNLIFGKFQIIDCLKKDEHSAVYLANHSYLSKKIILKSLNVKTISDKEKIERFKREARILAALDHPNIIKVLDFGTADDYFYISFEYFESENLRSLSSHTRLSEQDKNNLMKQLLAGLAYAHNSGIVHRDLKPENILVNENLQLKISDFGLAFSEKDDLITTQYSILGTPSYMSPEQVRGEKLTKNSDLFSAGIVLLELYTGSNPFRGEDISDSINRILNYEDDELKEHIARLPDNIQPLIQSLLRKTPGERSFPSIPVLNLSEQKSPAKKNYIYKLTAGLIILFLISVLTYLLFFEEEKLTNTNTTPLKTKTFELENEPEDFKVNDVSDKPEEEKSEFIPVEKTEEQTTGFLISTGTADENTGLNSNTANETAEESFQNGLLLVECIPWAEVEVNSEFIDVTPFNSPVEIPAGNIVLKFNHPDYPPLFKKVNLKPGVLNNIEVNLNEEFGFVYINVYPWGKIYINDKYYGETPLTGAIVLQPGHHVVIIKNPAYFQKNDTITVHRGDTLTLNYRLSTNQ
ncbi:MAG: hypothetical protein Kow0098_04150 [Ignavibacteriaceae bacterium]